MIRETLRHAAERAAVAPSVHNTQPWTFVLTPDALEIRSDTTRELTVLDPRRRQLTISCGCALFNARVAIAATGFEPIVSRFPDPYHPETLARVVVGEPSRAVPVGALDPAIDRRRTNRRKFHDEPIPPEFMTELVAAAQSESVQLMQIRGAEHRLTVAQLSDLADRIENNDPAYHDELRTWTTDHPRRRDGVQASTVPYLGVGAAPSRDELPIRAFDTRGMGWLPSSTRSSADQNLLLFCTDTDGPAAWLRVGEALEYVWLLLTDRAYAASPLTQLVEIAETRERLRTELDLPGQPQLMLRVGRAPETPRTLRQLSDDVIIPG